jgi:hypothetical protein
MHDCGEPKQREWPCPHCRSNTERMTARSATASRIAVTRDERPRASKKTTPVFAANFSNFSLVSPISSWTISPHSWTDGGTSVVMKITEMQFAFDDEGYWRLRANYDCFATFFSFAYTFTFLSGKTQRMLGTLGGYSGGALVNGSYVPLSVPPICYPGQVCPRGGPASLWGQVSRGAGTIEREGMSPMLRYDFQRIGTFDIEALGSFDW